MDWTQLQMYGNVTIKNCPATDRPAAGEDNSVWCWSPPFIYSTLEVQQVVKEIPHRLLLLTLN